ncbi:MAG: LysR family transcriptional regulator [Nannocystaceae bacterium]|nr:LysR family transcriptional regulator [Nannocystaceae bacterium]
MNWDDLRFLLATVRASTLTEAAKSLGVTQTTVTRRLAVLEEQLGVRLVSRTSQGIVVTDAGDVVASAATDIEERVAALGRMLLNRDDTLEGRLRVATIDMVAHYDAALFRTFNERYPEITLELTTGLDTRDLARDEADVAIRWTNNPSKPLVGRRLGPVPFALYASRALVDRIGADSPLEAYPWLAWMRELDAVVTAPWMRERTPSERVVARYNSALSLHGGVRAGLGIAFIPCMYAGPDLVCLAATEPGFEYDVWLLVHPEARAAARVRAFLDHTTEYYKNPR